MSFPLQIQHTQITSGDNLSGVFALKGADRVGIISPFVITSCQIFMRVGVTQNSGDLVRAFQEDGSSEFGWSIGAGSGAAIMRDVLAPYPFAQIETGVAQEDVRSFTIIVKI